MLICLLVINCAWAVFFLNTNKPTIVFKSPEKWVQGRGGPEKGVVPSLKNDQPHWPRWMELRWVLISAAVLINYKPPIQILLYLRKFVIYFIWLAVRWRWMVVRRKCCRDTKADERREKRRSATGHIGYYSAHNQVKQKGSNRK